jgi:hypothetical protein
MGAGNEGYFLKRTILTLLVTLCCLLFVPSIWAYDVGLMLDQNAYYAGVESDTAFAYKGLVIPRFSSLVGDAGEFYISAGINYQNNPWSFVPELLHTEFSWIANGMEISLGRISYSDPLGFIASGLFDGGRFSCFTEAGTFRAGAWYTGFIYKKRINIEMTDGDAESNDAAFDYGNFTGSYFAPRRVLAAFDWEHQGIGERVFARLSLLGQFDLTGAELNSQYLAGKMTVPFKSFAVSFGGCFEFMEKPGNVSTAFAAELGAVWKNTSQGLSLLTRYSSAESDSLAAFLPVTTNAQGQIFAAKLSGLSMASLDYTARLHRTFTISLTPSYFFLSDFINTSGKFFRGAEFFGAFYWSPLPDISVNLGGGAFLPSLGNVAPNEKTLWRVELNLVLSLF